MYRAAQEQQLAQHLAYEDYAVELKDEYKSYQLPIQESVPGGGGGGGGDSNGNAGMHQRQQRGRQSIGRLSFGGIGGPGRLFSLTSETTFARSMSGLSALSIDWENMDDFDVNLDHSAGINNDIINRQQQQGLTAQGQQGHGNGNQSDQKDGQRADIRSRIRYNIPISNGGSANNVSFNM